MNSERDDKALALIEAFSKKLRELAEDGDVPSEWKERVLAALRNRSGPKPNPEILKRDYEIAKEMLSRRIAGDAPTSAAAKISQRLYDQNQTSAPLEVSQIFEIERKYLFDVVADQTIDEWMRED